MFFFLYIFVIEIYAFSHIDSAERRVTAIKEHAQNLSKNAIDFTTKPIAPMLFYTYDCLQSDMEKLEKEMHAIHNSKFE